METMADGGGWDDVFAMVAGDTSPAVNISSSGASGTKQQQPPNDIDTNMFQLGYRRFESHFHGNCHHRQCFHGKCAYINSVLKLRIQTSDETIPFD